MAVGNTGQAADILFASTATADSDRAMDRAVLLSRGLEARLHVVSIVDPGLLPPDSVDKAVHRVNAQLQDDWRDYVAAGGTLDAEVVVGTPDEAIVEQANKVGAGLIVMGVSRDASMMRLFAGSTTEKVIRKSSCAVLTVKTKSPRDYDRIVVALDLSAAARRALDFALESFPKAHFNILHVDINTEGSEALIDDIVAARCLAAGHPMPGHPGGPEVTILRGNVGDALAEAVLQKRPDLLVLGTHARAGIDALFLGSTAEYLLETIASDVLIARA